MNKDSNKYTLIFAGIMVVIVAFVLSFVHQALKGTQDKNEEIDKMTQILLSIKVTTSNDEAENKFNEIIKEMFLVDTKGNKIPDSEKDAFSADMKAEMYKKEKDRKYPVFVANIDGEAKYIMALYGGGLWGPIWGYIATNSDGNTIYGANFDHQGETPGLGAEIANNEFSKKFEGKHIFKDGVFKSIAIVKEGKQVSDRDYIDGISGGTITSHGVDNMLLNTLSGYSTFLSNLREKQK